MAGRDSVSRRRFAALVAAAALPAAALAAPVRATARMTRPLIKPPRLRPGDLVGLVAPGGHTSDESIARACAGIEALGFRVKLGTHLGEVHGNYAGSVQQRLDDLHGMFADREVAAIWAIRGGSGCISLLAGLDYRLIRAHPKILIGYSDVTALHLAIHRHAGLMTFHGPVASSGASDYARSHLLSILMEPQAHYRIEMAPQFAPRTFHAGVATGPLMGGNLSLLSALVGTPYAADFRKCILFLEEVDEAPYRIDRMLTQLDYSTGLRQAAAVVVGVCENCGPPDDDPSLTLDETLALHLQPLTIPAVSNYSFGHIRDQFTLPMGAMAMLDTERHSLMLLEAGVQA